MTPPRYIILAPTGAPLAWTVSETADAAISKLLDGMNALWQFAQAQGYALERMH